MNDPGLHEPIDKDAQIIENKKQLEERGEEEEDEKSFLAPRSAVSQEAVDDLSISKQHRRAAYIFFLVLDTISVENRS